MFEYGRDAAFIKARLRLCARRIDIARPIECRADRRGVAGWKAVHQCIVEHALPLFDGSAAAIIDCSFPTQDFTHDILPFTSLLLEEGLAERRPKV